MSPFRPVLLVGGLLAGGAGLSAGYTGYAGYTAGYMAVFAGAFLAKLSDSS